MLCASELEIQLFNPLPRPVGFPQKFQTRLDTGIDVETANINSSSQLFPAIVVYETDEYFLQRNAMQRVVGLGVGHVFVEDALAFLIWGNMESQTTWVE